jgi:hypothetical protein
MKKAIQAVSLNNIAVVYAAKDICTAKYAVACAVIGLK